VNKLQWIKPLVPANASLSSPRMSFWKEFIFRLPRGRLVRETSSDAHMEKCYLRASGSKNGRPRPTPERVVCLPDSTGHSAQDPQTETNRCDPCHPCYADVAVKTCWPSLSSAIDGFKRVGPHYIAFLNPPTVKTRLPRISTSKSQNSAVP
jgi:hypothetical protein